MNEAVKIFSVLIFLTGITHVALFIITNKLRIKRLLTLVENFRNANLLTKSDYQYLRDRYTGFLSHMEFFPDKADYKVMYDNPEFSKFVNKTRTRLTYYAIVSALTFVILAIVLPTSK